MIFKDLQEWRFYSFKKPSSTSLTLCIECFSSCPSSVALCCTSSNLSVSLLFCGVQTLTQFSRCGLTSAEQRKTITFNPLALLLLKYVVSLHHYNGTLLPHSTLWSTRTTSFSVESLSTLLLLACPGAWGYSTTGAGLCILLC